MSLSRLNRIYLHRLFKRKYSNIVYYNEADDYTATPQYPPILDLSPGKVRERKKLAKHDAIKTAKSVEEKQIKLNMPKYYGFKCYMFNENSIPYDNLELTQHITRTHLIETEKLPKFYDDIKVEVLVKALESRVQDAILLAYEGYQYKHVLTKEIKTTHEVGDIIASAVVEKINREIINDASQELQHLKDLEIDISPRIESSWVVGGMNPPERVKSYRRNQPEWQQVERERENEPTDRVIQYAGSPLLALRTDKPLLPILPAAECEMDELDVPFWKYDPRTVGTTTDYKHVTNIPGFWPGDANSFGLLSIHSSCHLSNRLTNDRKDALHRQGVLASFAWLNAQANYQGFTTFNDITYPLIAQTLITNGRVWSTYLYQLNTLLLHSENTSNNPKRNICWATGERELFKEIQDGRVIGFNSEVLLDLVKLYCNTPEDRLGLNLRPFLGSEKVLADYEVAEKREWLEREYKYLMANRPRHKLPYEIYHWEKIYKIDHKLRQKEPRRRPFELFQNPFNRTLDDRKPNYIPRKMRPHLKRHLGRDAKEFWP